MRKAFILFGTVFLLFALIGSPVFAAAWKVPINMRVVQYGIPDTNGRIYNNIQSAIDSISDASAWNRYVVLVMPGEYAGPVAMKSFVDVVGSSRTNTIITSPIHNDDFDTCTAGTVTMADNSALRNIKVVNTAANGDYAAAAIAVANVSASIEDVDVLVGSDSSDVTRNNGICTVGSAGYSTIKNANIEVHSGRGDANGVLSLYDGSQTLINSRVTVFIKDTTENFHINAVDCDQGTGVGVTTISNSSVEGTSLQAGSGGVTLMNLAMNCRGVITASTFKAAGSSNELVGASVVELDFIMIDSQIHITGSSGTVAGVQWNPGGAIARLANNLIQGGINECAGMKLNGNYDENMDPITCP